MIADTPSDENGAASPVSSETRVYPKSRWILFWCLVIIGVAFDLTTKSIIFDRVGQPGSPAVDVITNILELRTSHNMGALWGFGNNWRYSSAVFASLSILASCGIVYWLFIKGAAADRAFVVSLGLIMAGALGNCYDRVVFGYVRDFMYFHIDPIQFECAIFNFADNMLIIGAVLLMLIALRPDPESEPKPASS